MAVFTMAGLTIKEAVRRRTLIGALLLGLLPLGLSLMYSLARYRMHLALEAGRLSEDRYFIGLAGARSFLMSLSLSCIKWLGGLFALMLAGGSISGEIERGLLAVILPKPIPRWQILLGKWLGLNVVLTGSVLVWTALVWASFTLQLHEEVVPLLVAGFYLALFPFVISTLALTLSTFAQRLLGTSLALILCAMAWFDGILDAIGKGLNVDVMRTMANVFGLLVPQGYIGWWVENSTDEIITQTPNRVGTPSPQFLTDWGKAHLHFMHLDAVYVALYVLVLFALGVYVFQKRDV